MKSHHGREEFGVSCRCFDTEGGRDRIDTCNSGYGLDFEVSVFDEGDREKGAETSKRVGGEGGIGP